MEIKLQVLKNKVHVLEKEQTTPGKRIITSTWKQTTSPRKRINYSATPLIRTPMEPTQVS